VVYACPIALAFLHASDFDVATQRACDSAAQGVNWMNIFPFLWSTRQIKRGRSPRAQVLRAFVMRRW
jgi:hypothetical protein